MVSGRLRQFIDAKRDELPALRREFSPGWCGDTIAALATPPHFACAIQPECPDAIRLICEIKPGSPSAGSLADPQRLLDEVLPHYNQHAAALSVLTEPRFFGGSPRLFRQVGKLSPLPRLWKDFVIDPYQAQLARALGGSAILLIVKALEGEHLRELYEASLESGLTPVVEVQTEAETERALALNARVVLVNNRDLETLEVDLATTERLAPIMTPDVCCISASGIKQQAELKRLSAFTRTFLIGTSLMQSDSQHLGQLLASFNTTLQQVAHG